LPTPSTTPGPVSRIQTPSASFSATAGIFIAPKPLSIIEERMPPDTVEQRHLHHCATQFFYVLAGELIIELAGEEHRLPASTGLAIPSQTPHQVFNRSREDARFLVISQPPSHGDRAPAAHTL
jgi:mannose-6-phosphate isomerase-like protein (cupin superfamily)